jgi:hypothetical protein
MAQRLLQIITIRGRPAEGAVKEIKMKKSELNLVGMAALGMTLFGSSYAYAVPASGAFAFNAGNATLTPAGNISAGTTAKTLVSPGSANAASSGNLGIAAGAAVTISPLTQSLLSGPSSLVLTAPSTTGGGGTLTFTFTTQTLNTLIATNTATNTAGFINETINGTLTGTGATGLNTGAPVQDTQTCTQPVVGGVAGQISCTDSLIVGTLTTTTTTSIPEPTSLALLGAALVGFGLVRGRRKAA